MPIMRYQSGLSTVMVVMKRKPAEVNAVPVTGKIRYFPVREMIWPEPIEAIISPSTIGSVAKPDCVADQPGHDLQVQRQREQRAEHAEADEHAEHVAIEKTRERKSFSGMIASSPIRRLRDEERRSGRGRRPRSR